ncbi:MAG: hypothetical protein Q7K26_03035, partial [bacterium]|nr:hypothetical protein [bacterium]
MQTNTSKVILSIAVLAAAFLFSQKVIVPNLLTLDNIKPETQLAQVTQATATTQPLIQQPDLQYLGGFRLPRGQFGGSNFTNGGLVMAYNQAKNSLFIVGHGDFAGPQSVAEISIPAPVNSSNILSLKTATVLQSFADITDGHINDALTTSCAAANIVGGLLVEGSTIYSNVYCAYDNGIPSQSLALGKSGLTLSDVTDFRGFFQYNAAPQPGRAGFLSGWITKIPTAWQGLLGGDALVGNCCLSITNRTSWGPSAYSIKLSDIGVVNPVVPIPLLYYTGDHPLVNRTATSNIYNASTAIRGVVFPEGSRSVLYFGRQGTGTVCYGQGQDNPALHGVDVGTTHMCFDPADHNKGYHVYPYQSQILAYDANDLLAVKNGTKLPWDTVPYAIIPMNFPIKTGDARITGAA